MHTVAHSSIEILCGCDTHILSCAAVLLLENQYLAGLAKDTTTLA